MVTIWKRERMLCKCGHAKSFHRMADYTSRKAAACNFGDCKCREFRRVDTDTKETSASQQSPPATGAVDSPTEK